MLKMCQILNIDTNQCISIIKKPNETINASCKKYYYFFNAFIQSESIKSVCKMPNTSVFLAQLNDQYMKNNKS